MLSPHFILPVSLALLGFSSWELGVGAGQNPSLPEGKIIFRHMASRVRVYPIIQSPPDSHLFPVIHSRQKLGILFHSPSKCPQKISCSSSSRMRGRLFVVKSQQAKVNRTIADDRMLVLVPPHPLIKHWVSVLRDERTPSPIFRNAMAELGRLLIYEASRDWLPTVTGEIQSPMGVASVEFIDPREPVLVVPILRAGLALVEHASSILPATKTYHLGISRDEMTLLPSIYLNKLPEKIPEGSRVLIADPMLATGGTIVAAIDMLKDRGVDKKKIKVISAVAAPPALQKLSEKFNGFIIPGLGDAGDRSFGT
ncbi:uracil phosphoribosyltransferase-like isoform X3 [Macadamia integrifolia]|uniref:uracil phosphoribosyltransferase-like isoform X3 n=1 Tax=Macadamia integrifolia TaxID=60698 RepID=UPI001C4E48BA|nr:uracil phosphoribosyltransferase-like isoform X3 [Macadamia integrifolia]